MGNLNSLERFTGAIRFVTTDVWRIRARGLPPLKAGLVRLLRIGLIAFKGFQRHNCSFRASALTFYSLLSIVPVLAMAFGMAKGFGFEKALEKQVLSRFSGQEEVIVRATAYANTLLENTKGGLIAGIGILLLFWSVIQVFSNIEAAFNHIWGIEKPRSLARKISDYLSAILICPVLFIASSTATVMITSQVKGVVGQIALLKTIGPAILYLLHWLPFVVIWILFTFVYLFMPNAKIRFSSGVVAGVVAGTLYQVFQWVYVSFQIGVAKYNAIYGSFAALPLFLVWLQLSWMIVLFGAEISNAHQTEESHEFGPDCEKASLRLKQLAALRVVHLLVKVFSERPKPLTVTAMAAQLGAPTCLVSNVINDLAAAGVVSEICAGKGDEKAYQPAQDVEAFTIQYILDQLENQGIDTIPLGSSPELEKLSASLKALNEEAQKSPGNVMLKKI